MIGLVLLSFVTGMSGSEFEVMEVDSETDSAVTGCLDWKDGTGSLPESDFKFFFNEFGILEMVDDTKFETNEEIFKKPRELKEKDNMEQLTLQCETCRRKGTPANFFQSKFCSVGCQDLAVIKQQEPSTESRAKTDNDVEESSAKAGTSYETFLKKLTLELISNWQGKNKKFSWKKYLNYVKAEAAPVALFKNPFPANRNIFQIGMKLEGIDPKHPSKFCIMTIKDVIGYRICMHFDGYPSKYDFWINADSPDIFPMGWCKRNNHTICPPPPYTAKNFDSLLYLKKTKGLATPNYHFFKKAFEMISPSGFRIGMKLEAVHKLELSRIYVATILDIMDNRILVHFDGRDDIDDFWAEPTSPFIHPVGWCEKNGHNLTAPSNYPPKTFTWKQYLKESKAVAAPARSFKPRTGKVAVFKKGMRLECVDKRAPHVIRVATVNDVTEHHIEIVFDGWPYKYSYWVENVSPDIHPPNWSQKTGHPVDPPLTPEDLYNSSECTTVGCRGQGHTEGLTTHSSREFCPYADENIDKVLPDRLLNPDSE
ncbi:unnamed protein product [Ceutorhynchus assimilis]|uniref:Lethal(3)malignant brain tumor-like protein 3 n=1 Tax=Ceutorhynchus assimilis TaxID=467358 RepID=A0A9N9MG20_9CUCU|nr:unnamed protein product [Ceutorhynchus assimilis]